VEIYLQMLWGKSTVSDRHQIRVRLRLVVGLGWRSDLVVFPLWVLLGLGLWLVRHRVRVRVTMAISRNSPRWLFYTLYYTNTNFMRELILDNAVTISIKLSLALGSASTSAFYTFEICIHISALESLPNRYSAL